MRYFTTEELTRSETALKKGIDNTPSEAVKANLMALVDNVLDPIRERWGGPIKVNSGYRCKVLNTAVGGSPKSQHMTGQAADITVSSKVANKNLFLMLKESGLPFDQLIDEYDYQWIHVSYRADGTNRGMVRHLS
ncbi:MAG: D-Ala-D-Ala carboxypeptidase family metallohydrolase [Bacteroidales bacterium]|nr:D-Ala-D-Ala carboxypeptidase family metallohydrolase [Bacteroidales bacterium]